MFSDKSLKRIVFAMFFFSGISGLMYQVVWVRMLSRTMGVTLHATSTVLAAFMAGLALGSFIAGRIVDKRRDGLRMYGWLEIGIAASALLVPILLKIATPLYLAVYTGAGEGDAMMSFVRLAVCFVALLIPTTMMGATLPILTSFLVKRESLFGRSFSLLYGLNTFGAVIGVIASGFITLGLWGETRTMLIGALINTGVGIIAIRLYRSGAADTETAAAVAPEAEHKISPYPDAVRRFVLVAFALSGMTALAYEVIWTRQLIIFLKTSIYAFSGMLAVFLTGIALGSLAMNKIVDKIKHPLRWFAVLELVVAVLWIFNLYLFAPLDSHIAHKLLGFALSGYAAVVIVFPLTFVFGLITPIAARCYARSEESTGSSIGWFYAANTVGSIVGALLAGFWLVPRIGSVKAVIVLAVVNLVVAAGLVLLDPKRSTVRKLAWAPAVLLIGFIAYETTDYDPFRTAIERRIRDRVGTTWIPNELAKQPNTEEIFFHGEGLEGTVTAFAINTFPQLWINSVGMAFLNTETKLMAHLPLMFSKARQEMLIICYGMGTTSRSASNHDDLNITTVELVPETYQVNKYFYPNSQDVNKKINKIVNDGRNYLFVTDKTYDVITVDPPPPIYSARTVNLYSREFFDLAKSRMNPGGIVCMWFPEGTEIEVKSLLRTFREVFPHVTVFSGPHSWGFYYIGSDQPLDWERFRERADTYFADPRIVSDMREYDDDCVSREQLELQLLWDEEAVERIAAEGVLITDDFPFTEFPLFRYLRGERAIWHPQNDLNINDWELRAEFYAEDNADFERQRAERERRRREDGTYHTYPSNLTPRDPLTSWPPPKPQPGYLTEPDPEAEAESN